MGFRMKRTESIKNQSILLAYIHSERISFAQTDNNEVIYLACESGIHSSDLRPLLLLLFSS